MPPVCKFAFSAPMILQPFFGLFNIKKAEYGVFPGEMRLEYGARRWYP